MSELAEEYETEEYLHILDIVDIDNMVPELDDTILDKLGADVCDEYQIDKASMEDWLERNKLAMKLIDMKPEKRSDPWPGASNTKLPLVLNAAMKASAEEFAEIMRGTELVKTEIFGTVNDQKQARSQRVSKCMNHQFFHELEDWEEDHDKLILSKNIVGTVHKKIFYSKNEGIQCVLRRNGVVINDNVEKIQDAPRVTDEIEKLWWQAQEKINSGEWEEIDLSKSDDQEFAESDRPNTFLEQIRREDLDGDGYPEPYIVTVHERTKQVVRIQPNFTPESIEFNEDFDPLEYDSLSDENKATIRGKLTVVRIDHKKARLKYVKYSMIPSWEGGYWDFGFGMLLSPLNENCNTLINQLLNAGHLANKGGGFINSGIKMGGGELRFRSNEWKKVASPGMDLSRNIVPMPVKEPSQTLFSLLGLLMDVLRELSSVTEVMSGDQPKANMPAASIDMLIEQGKKMFNSVYKRHYRSLSKEQTAIFDLNYLYLKPKQYAELLDIEVQGPELMQMIRSDFSRQGMDVLPTANPEFSSKVQRMATARGLLELREDPNVNGALATRMYVEALVDDTELAAEVVPDQPNMTPQQVQEQMAIQKQEMMDELDTKEAQAKAQMAGANAETARINLAIAQQEAENLRLKLPAEEARKVAEGNRAEKIAKFKEGIEQLKQEAAALDLDKGRVQARKERDIAPLEVEEKRLAVLKAEAALANERQKPPPGQSPAKQNLTVERATYTPRRVGA